MSQKAIKEIEDRVASLNEEKERLWAEREKEIEEVEARSNEKLGPVVDEIVTLNEKLKDIVTSKLARPEELEFDGWDKVTEKMAYHLTFEQIVFLVWKRSGKVDVLRTDVHGTEYRPSHEPTLEKIKEVGIRYLQSNPCRYCHLVTHGDANCMMVCETCNNPGHSFRYCPWPSSEEA